MKLKRRGVPIVLVVITSVVAVSSAIAMADSPTMLFKGNITSTAPPPNSAGTDLYFYLPIVSRNYPVHGAWLEVGTGSASEGSINSTNGTYGNPSIAIAPDGTPYLAWHDERSESSQIYVRRWNGMDWEEVGAGSASGGGISDTSGSASWPSIAIAPDGSPYVAWREYINGDAQIYVRRWNGSTWEEVGAGSASGGGITNSFTFSSEPEIAIDPDGRPYVTWEEDWPDAEIYVRRWNGSSWEEVGAGSASSGGISATIDHSRSPSIAVAPDGTPYITWLDGIACTPCPYEIYVRRWIGGH